MEPTNKQPGTYKIQQNRRHQTREQKKEQNRNLHLGIPSHVRTLPSPYHKQ